MQLVPELFAASLLEKIHGWSAARSGTFQTLVFFGVVAVIALVVFGWAIILRQQPRRHHHRSHSKPAAAELGDEASTGGFFFRRRHKQRRKAHRPINPTLAETGGLPVPRDRKPPPTMPPPPPA